jgi:hypothetical protein
MFSSKIWLRLMVKGFARKGLPPLRMVSLNLYPALGNRCKQYNPAIEKFLG